MLRPLADCSMFESASGRSHEDESRRRSTQRACPTVVPPGRRSQLLINSDQARRPWTTVRRLDGFSLFTRIASLLSEPSLYMSKATGQLEIWRMEAHRPQLLRQPRSAACLRGDLRPLLATGLGGVGPLGRRRVGLALHHQPFSQGALARGELATVQSSPPEPPRSGPVRHARMHHPHHHHRSWFDRVHMDLPWQTTAAYPSGGSTRIQARPRAGRRERGAAGPLG